MKKIIITIFITLIFVIIVGFYTLGIAYAISEDGGPALIFPLSTIIFIGIIGIIGVLIYNMYDRIKEIKRGDENDISKY